MHTLLLLYCITPRKYTAIFGGFKASFPASDCACQPKCVMCRVRHTYCTNSFKFLTSQNGSGWCRAHWFLVGVEKHNVLFEVSSRCTHHRQLRNCMMSHDTTASHHQPSSATLFMSPSLKPQTSPESNQLGAELLVRFAVLN